MSDLKPEREAEIRKLHVEISPMEKEVALTLAVGDLLAELNRLRLALKNEVADRYTAVQAALEMVARALELRAIEVHNQRGLEHEARALELKAAAKTIRSLCTTNALEELLDERARVEFAGGIRVATEELRGGKLHQDHPALVEFRAALERRLLEARIETAAECERRVHAEMLKPFDERAYDMPCTEYRVELQVQLAALDATMNVPLEEK